MARTVLITGASTGIGEQCALLLAERGMRVLAGVRRAEDGERLRARAQVEPVLIDVTDQASIEAAARGVERLDGLVNNAGIAISGPLEFLPVDDLRRQLEVNVIGQLAVTQAFLPALRVAQGRIVNISSIGGRIAMPLVGPYAASKFALEGLSDSLRRELRSWGIEVSVIEPGGVRTPIWAKATDVAEQIQDGMPAQAGELYGELIASLRTRSEKIAREGIHPEEVAQAVAHALTARRPRTRYLVGRDAKLRARVVKVLPDRVFDALVARALRD